MTPRLVKSPDPFVFPPLQFISQRTQMITLTYDPIDYSELTESVRSNDSGAVVLFLGTVRELTHGRRTIALHYEGYPEMAEQVLKDLDAVARSRWPIDRLAIVHRLGRLELGEISVAIAVSCPHRQAAFEAGQFLIDELKVRVPIWKQENWSDGTSEWIHPGSPDETPDRPGPPGTSSSK